MNKLRNSAKIILSLLLLVVAFATNSAYAQKVMKYDSVRKWGAAKWENEYLWRLKGNKKYQAYDTLSKTEFKTLARKYAIRELTDYDTAYQHFLVMKQRPPYQDGWKFASTIGPNFPYCGSWNATDKTMFLKPGFNANLHADHYWGKIGLGALFGYMNAGVNKTDHQAEMIRVASNYGIPSNRVGFSPYKSFENIYLLLGPVASLPLGRKFTLDASLKGGIFRNDPAFLQAYDLVGGRVIQQVYADNKRNAFGYNLGLALLYKLTEQWSVGAAADIYDTKASYQTLGAVGKGPVDSGQPIGFTRNYGGYRIGAAVAYKLVKDKVVAIAPLTPPACMAPVIEDGLAGKKFDLDTYERPVFKWKSGNSMSGDETYTFKLYKSGNTNPIYQTTSNLATVLWPKDIPFGKEPGCYYYTVHSSRANKGGTCMSEVATSQFCVNEKPCPPPVPPVVCDKYVHKIYGGEVQQTYTVKRYIKDTICTCNDKDLYEYRYVTKKRKKDATTESFVSSYSKEFEKTDVKAELPADFVLPKDRSSFYYEIQQAPCGQYTQPRTVAKYKIYVGNKGKYQGMYKIEQVPF